METPETNLEVFSAILIEEYIRLMTAADYLQNDKKNGGTKFEIAQDVYDELQREERHDPLIGLRIEYKDGILTAFPSEEFLNSYDNKIMREVVILFAENYKHRYKKFISCLANN